MCEVVMCEWMVAERAIEQLRNETGRQQIADGLGILGARRRTGYGLRSFRLDSFVN